VNYCSWKEILDPAMKTSMCLAINGLVFLSAGASANAASPIGKVIQLLTDIQG